MSYQYLQTPIGTLRLVSDNLQLIKIEFENHYSHDDHLEASNAVLTDCADQLTDYFAGRRQRFALPLAAGGTAFQQSVWDALTDIPYGEIRCYRDIARSIGNPATKR
jgi:methylated-DNA-[protein]-cysteine S-methyltransferase